MKRVLWSVVVVVLVGQLCGCGAARQAAAKKDAMESAAVAMSRFSDKSLDPIRGKASFPGSYIKSPTSAPNECPTEGEKEAVNRLREIIIDNKRDAVALVGKHIFRDAQPQLAAFDALILNAGRLYRCEITYQQYAEERERINSAADAASMNIAQQIDVENKIRAQQTAAAFGAALQNVGNAMQQQEAIRQANRPRQTTCRKIGNTISCTEF